MKSFPLTVAASILTVFTFAPSGLAASAIAAPNLKVATDSPASARPIVIAQLSPGVAGGQGDDPQAQQNTGDPGQASSADSDDQNTSDTDQNAGDTDQNGDPNNPDADQNAQTDDNGDNSDQGSGDAADAQANNGETADQNADNSAAAQ
jgi:hypothetical protein